MLLLMKIRFRFLPWMLLQPLVMIFWIQATHHFLKPTQPLHPSWHQRLTNIPLIQILPHYQHLSHYPIALLRPPPPNICHHQPLSLPPHKLPNQSAHHHHHPLPLKWPLEHNMAFLSLANFSISTHQLHTQFLPCLPIPLMHYKILIGKWPWPTNIMLLLKIRRGT